MRSSRALSSSRLTQLSRDRAWERGRVSPDVLQLEAIAAHFGFPAELLVTPHGMDRIDPVTKQPRRPSGTIAATPSDTHVPVYGRIAFAQPLEAMPVEDEYWLPPDVLAAHPSAFFLRVHGESMNRVLPDGTLALIDPGAEVRNGDIAAVHIDGQDATIKHYFRGSNTVTLAPDSNDESFTDLIFDYSKPGTEEVTPIGRKVWQLVPYGEASGK